MAEANRHSPESATEDFEKRIDDLEGSLMEQVEHDHRFSSSVPPEQQADDLDFIQMTGLTAPSAPASIEDETPAVEPTDLDPTLPVSFYEEGVQDVDNSLEPISLTDAPTADEDIVSESPLSFEDPSPLPMEITNSTSALKEIIAELSNEDPVAEELLSAQTESVSAERTTLEDDPSPGEDPVEDEILLEEEPAAVSAAETPEESDAVSGLDEEVAPDNDSNAAVIEEVSDDEHADEIVQASESTTEDAALEEDRADTPDSGERDSTIEESDAVVDVDDLGIPPSDEDEPESVDSNEVLSTDVAEVLDEIVPETPRTTPVANLEEAEQLLQELEAEEAKVEIVNSTGADTGVEALPVETAAPEDIDGDRAATKDDAVAAFENEDDESVYHQPKTHSVQRRKRHKRNPLRRLARLIPPLAVVATVVFGAYWGYQFYTNQTASPEQAYAAAERLLENGKYVEASNAFSDFAASRMGDSKRPDAQFMAGFALHLFPSISNERALEAIESFQNFVEQNPVHAKRLRAEILIGILFYRAGSYQDAIQILENPALRTGDAGGSLAAMRALAQSYAEVGESEKAISTLMRVASRDGNYRADDDHKAIAQIFERLAQQATTESERQKFRSAAITQWNFTLKGLGLPASTKRVYRSDLSNRFEGIRFSGGLAYVSGQAAPNPEVDAAVTNASPANE